MAAVAKTELDNLKVLVVEDSEDLVGVWRALFRKHGIQARFCTSGKAALALLEDERDYHPDVVMTDYYLPDTTGIELVGEVRRRSPGTDCLMVTGNHDDAFAQSIAEERVPLLFKPVRFADLLKAISECPRAAAGHGCR